MGLDQAQPQLEVDCSIIDNECNFFNAKKLKVLEFELKLNHGCNWFPCALGSSSQLGFSSAFAIMDV